ncbi:MAG: hypothetical protein WCL28_14425, partial [bacterium]
MMNRHRALRIVSIFCIAIASCVFLHSPLSVARATAGVPSILSYQGRLTDSSGNLLGGTGTNYYFKFSIWNSANVGNGAKLWPSANPSV